MVLLEQSFVDDGTYTDPTGHADGREALVADIAGFHAMMPGHTIDMNSGVDVYGDVFRFGAGDAQRHSGRAQGHGLRRARERLVPRIVGFFGPFPPAG